MEALGYNPRLYRTLAFGLGGGHRGDRRRPVGWYNTPISRASIDLDATNDVLIVAVIGGLYRARRSVDRGASCSRSLETYVPNTRTATRRHRACLPGHRAAVAGRPHGHRRVALRASSAARHLRPAPAGQRVRMQRPDRRGGPCMRLERLHRPQEGATSAPRPVDPAPDATSASTSAACTPSRRGPRRRLRRATWIALGPNGAGKTTLFNLVAGDFATTSGSVELFGTDVTTCRTEAARGSG